MPFKPNNLDSRVSDVFSRRAQGRVGIELEVEGVFPDSAYGMRFWTCKEEGSLRNGVEFVLKKPMTQLDLPLQELESVLKDSRVKKTIRCSTHIHVNVCSLTLREVYQAAFAWFLLEELIVQTQGPLRMGNLFCLRMSDADALADLLRASILDKVYFHNFSAQTCKYAALNMNAVSRFGSLEFRFLRPLDPAQIAVWADVLDRIVSVGSKTDTRELLAGLERESTEKFLSRFFTPTQITMFCQHLPSFATEELLNENFDRVKDLADTLYRTKKKYFQIPVEYLDDDLEGSPYRIAPTPSPQLVINIDDAVEEWVSLDEDFDDFDED